jgi:hypothetical protein
VCSSDLDAFHFCIHGEFIESTQQSFCGIDTWDPCDANHVEDGSVPRFGLDNPNPPQNGMDFLRPEFGADVEFTVLYEPA